MYGIHRALFLLCLLAPRPVTAQTTGADATPWSGSPESVGRVSVHAAAGATALQRGNVQSASIGYLVTRTLTVLLNAERAHVPRRITRHEFGGSATRGGTVYFLAGEVRYAFPLARRLSPYFAGGVGAGVSHPNVNRMFSNRITNNARIIVYRGGVDVPLRARSDLDILLVIGIEASL